MKHYIYYDEHFLGPGYFIYDINTQNFFKLGFNWNLDDEIEYFIFSGQKNEDFNMKFSSCNEDDPLYDFLQYGYDLIGNKNIGNQCLNFFVNKNDIGYDLIINKKNKIKYLYYFLGTEKTNENYTIINDLYTNLEIQHNKCKNDCIPNIIY